MTDLMRIVSEHLSLSDIMQVTEDGFSVTFVVEYKNGNTMISTNVVVIAYSTSDGGFEVKNSRRVPSCRAATHYFDAYARASVVTKLFEKDITANPQS